MSCWQAAIWEIDGIKLTLNFFFRENVVAAGLNAMCCKYAAIQHDSVLCKEFGLEKTNHVSVFFFV